MDIEIFIGIPYNSWMPYKEALKYTHTIDSIRITIGDFVATFWTNKFNKSIDVTIKLNSIIDLHF